MDQKLLLLTFLFTWKPYISCECMQEIMLEQWDFPRFFYLFSRNIFVVNLLCYFSTLFPCKLLQGNHFATLFPCKPTFQWNYFVRAFSQIHWSPSFTRNVLKVGIQGNCLIHSAMRLKWKNHYVIWIDFNQIFLKFIFQVNKITLMGQRIQNTRRVLVSLCLLVFLFPRNLYLATQVTF